MTDLGVRDSGLPWVGTLPVHWDLQPLLAVVRELQDSNIGMIEDNLLSLSYGKIIRKDMSSNDGLLPESFETYQIVNAGDIICRLTDLQNDKRSLRSALVCERGIITSAYLAIRPTNAVSEYLNYLLRAYDLSKVFYSMGGGLRQSMKFADLKRLPVILPPLPEQTAIAAFLDRETAKIDALVEEQKRLIALLQEKRQAVISHAVTKGLNPDAPMKDSGVEWLGEVPAHWEVRKFNRVVKIAEGQVNPELEPYKSMVLIAPNHIESQTGRLIYTETAEEQSAESGKYLCRAGDVIYSKIRPALAKVTIAPIDCLCSADMYPMSSTKDLVHEYLFYVFLSRQFTAWSILEADRVAMPKINRESLSGLSVPIPPKDEQITIVQHLEREVGRFDALLTNVKSAIALLQERRSALISAAVTGKIDVRGLVDTLEAAQ
jgi:type I restriction enzyme, S subunit